jgi:hypothetical protein
MTPRNLISIAAVAAGLVVAAGSAGAQATGAPAPRSGFSIERLVMELSSFLPEEYARLRAAPGGQGQGQQGAQPPAGQPQAGQRQGGQRPGGINLPQFKRDPRLMLTAQQVDALLPVLQELQKTPFPTPSQAKKVTAAVEASLTRQQKDAYEKFAKERDAAIEEMRKQYQSRSGTQQGAPGAQGGQGPAQAGPGAQGQQRDPADLRKRMLDTFIANVQEYRKGLR